MASRTPASRLSAAPDTGARLFAVDAFCTQARPSAARQAARTYGHLPADLRERAVDRALRDLRTHPPAATDRRALRVALAETLTDQLRRAHATWSLGEPADSAAAAPPDVLSSFIEDGLPGLERAVLQLEIGAGRDTATARAVLKLGPREYARHRAEGL